MSYFKQFPTVNYDLNRDGSIMQMVNIFRSVRPLQNLIDDTALYKFYEIQNGERPDIVSQKLYGTTDFYWTFFIVNDFLHDGYKVWPMSQEMLSAYINEEYSGVAINTRIEFDGDNAVRNSASLAGKFKIGETVRGQNSSAEGKIFKKDIDLNQLIIQDLDYSNGGPFIGDGDRTSQNHEKIRGLTSGSIIESYKVWDYAAAPHHYYILDENGVEREYANTAFIDPGGDNDINKYINVPADDPTTPDIDESDFITGAHKLVYDDITLRYVTNRQYVNALNEERSKIRVINPEYIATFVEEFERLINE